jgi:hypothetical protein
MITKIMNQKEVNIIENWSEITTGQYNELVDLYEKVDDLTEELFLLKFIQILSNLTEEDIYALYDEDLLIFTELMSNFNLVNFKPEKKDSFILNGQLYSYNLPSKLTFGEKISISLLQKRAKTKYDEWLNILSIFIRPATETQNEFGDKKYIVEAFNGDIDIILKRKELLKQIPAINTLWILTAFMNGNAS